MGLLKKIGDIVLKITEIISGVSPLFPQYQNGTQVAVSELQQIGAVISNIEVFGQVLGTPGADKLKAATPVVAQLILQSALLVNHKIENSALFTQGAGKIADGMADVMNSLKDSLATDSKAA